MAQRNHLQQFRQAQLTGNAAYDALPDQVQARNAAESKYHWDRFEQGAPIVPRQHSEDIARDVAAEGVTDFGNTTAGKVVGGVVSSPFMAVADIFGKGIGYLNTPKGTKWSDYSRNYDRLTAQTAGSVAHDTANNFQLQWNRLKRGAGDVGRFAAKWVDPRSWGSSPEARVNRLNHDIKWDDAVARTNARDVLISRNYHDKALRNTGSGIGKWNHLGNAAVGELAGSTVATAGIGGASKGIGTGIRAGTRSLAARTGAATTKAVNAAARAANVGQAPGRAAQATSAVSNAMGNAVNRGIQEMGKVVASPFEMVGTFANPVTGVRGTAKAVYAPAKEMVGAAARGVYRTGREAIRPGADLMGMLRHPVANARSGWQYIRQHPFAAAGRPAAYGGRYLWNVGREGAKGVYGVAKPALGAVMSNPVMYGGTALSAYDNASRGNYGDALRDIGSMGVYGALGPLGTPYYIWHDVLPAFTGGDSDEYHGG